MDKVRHNEQMIVSYKYDPHIKKAKERLATIQGKVKEQQ